MGPKSLSLFSLSHMVSGPPLSEKKMINKKKDKSQINSLQVYPYTPSKTTFPSCRSSPTDHRLLSVTHRAIPRAGLPVREYPVPITWSSFCLYILCSLSDSLSSSLCLLFLSPFFYASCLNRARYFVLSSRFLQGKFFDFGFDLIFCI